MLPVTLHGIMKERWGKGMGIIKYSKNEKKGITRTAGESKSIRIYPEKDKIDGIMWKIHPPRECFKKFGEYDLAKDTKELADKIYKISKFLLSNK
jgi:hypothetical protein